MQITLSFPTDSTKKITLTKKGSSIFLTVADKYSSYSEIKVELDDREMRYLAREILDFCNNSIP